MHATIRERIVEVLTAHPSVVAIALRRRAKFEGWLKFELASLLEETGLEPVRVEEQLPNLDENRRADITFASDGVRYWLELKTPRMGGQLEGVENTFGTMGMDIRAVIQDASRLMQAGVHGVVGFAVFPVGQNDVESSPGSHVFSARTRAVAG